MSAISLVPLSACASMVALRMAATPRRPRRPRRSHKTARRCKSSPLPPLLCAAPCGDEFFSFLAIKVQKSTACALRHAVGLNFFVGGDFFFLFFSFVLSFFRSFSPFGYLNICPSSFALPFSHFSFSPHPFLFFALRAFVSSSAYATAAATGTTTLSSMPQMSPPFAIFT